MGGTCEPPRDKNVLVVENSTQGFHHVATKPTQPISSSVITSTLSRVAVAAGSGAGTPQNLINLVAGDKSGNPSIMCSPSPRQLSAGSRDCLKQSQVASRGLCDLLCINNCDASSVATSKKAASGGSSYTLGPEMLEELVGELFRLHDLDGNGLLSESELIRINEAISEIHHGSPEKSVRNDLHTKYQQLFRDQLDPEGMPVPYGRFREYIMRVVGQYDKHADAQAMIVEQWVAEAHTARLVGDCGAPPPDPWPAKAWNPSRTSNREVSKTRPSLWNWPLDCCMVEQSVRSSNLCATGLYLE